jgi:hypothetical protein
MDLVKHYTHWRVLPHVRGYAEDIRMRFGGSWNTYFDHPEGFGLDSTSVDHWGPEGRGDPLPEAKGDAIVSWALGMHVKRPIRWLIWWGWMWTPYDGWVAYSGWQGSHKGRDGHIHITYF